MKLSSSIGYIIIFVVCAFGVFAGFDLYKEFNIQSQIIGYFQTNEEVVKINDFEYDIKSLLFYKADNENQYFATATAKPVSNFDSSKKYTVTINGIEANRVAGEYAYIDSNFTNQFNSSLNEVILTDTLNIKINFYAEGTKIVFITNNGEQAVKLWSSYIQKNGFTIKIIETDYIGQMEVDKIPTKLVSFYFNNELYETKEYNILNYSSVVFPSVINGIEITAWQDENGLVYSSLTEHTTDELKLYAQYEINKLNLVLNSSTLSSNVIRDTGLTSTLHQSWLEFNPISSTQTISMFENILNSTDEEKYISIQLVDLDYDGIYKANFLKSNLNSSISVSSTYVMAESLYYTYSGYGTSHYDSFHFSTYIKIENNCIYFRLVFTVSNDSALINENVELIDETDFNIIYNGFKADSENNIFSENLKLQIELI